MSDPSPQPPGLTDGRATSEVLRDILVHLQELLRAEVRLAKAEVRDDMRVATSSLAPLAVGVLTAASAWLFLLWSAAYALALVVPMWAATAIVAAATAVAGLVLLRMGMRRLKQVRAVPARTIKTLKENVAWIKQSSN